VHIKLIQATIIAGLLLGMLILPQLSLADGPEITVGPVPLELTSTSVTIYFSTNTSSTGCVYYGTNTSSWTPVCDSVAVAAHFIQLINLTPSTMYYYWIQATDASGPTTNNNTGSYYNFTTGPPTFSITIEPVCGVCGELIDVGTCGEVIGVTASVAAAGTYHICWDSCQAWNSTRLVGRVNGFTTTGAGSHTLTFFLPESKKGIHNVYLTDTTYTARANSTFEVLPSVKLDSGQIPPDEGPVGTNVTLNGYGFDASQDIRVSFLGEVIRTATANSLGSWNVSYAIPDTPAADYTFKVEAKEGTGLWVNYVSKYFKVTPQITVDRSSAKVGETIRVDGTGFASKEKNIEITFGGKTVKKISYAQDNGSWSDIIQVLPVQRGDYEIDASGEKTRARDVDPVTLTVIPGILLDPISAYVGYNITVQGGAFESGETGIKVSFDGKVVTHTLITAGDDGCWESSFVLDASTSGIHIVSAYGDITQPPVTNNLTTLTKIDQPSPAEGAPGDPVTITGSGFDGSKKLTVQISGKDALGEDGQPLDVRTYSNGNIAVTFRVPACTAGKQTLEVKDDGGATTSANFTVTTKVLLTPQPISPEKNTTLRSGEITFRWGGITGGSNITYILQISNSTNVATYVLHIPDIETSTYTLSKEEALTLTKGTYYWWVKAVDNYNNESLWSDPSSFTVSPIPTWVWVVVGLVVLVGLMVVAYRETKFKVTE
jgi:hypothetical protein